MKCNFIIDPDTKFARVVCDDERGKTLTIPITHNDEPDYKELLALFMLIMEVKSISNTAILSLTNNKRSTKMKHTFSTRICDTDIDIVLHVNEVTLDGDLYNYTHLVHSVVYINNDDTNTVEFDLITIGSFMDAVIKACYYWLNDVIKATTTPVM